MGMNSYGTEVHLQYLLNDTILEAVVFMSRQNI